MSRCYPIKDSEHWWVTSDDKSETSDEMDLKREREREREREKERERERETQAEQ